MIALPSLRQLGYLVALAQYLNFTRAAAACFVTQSTLSSGLKELEATLGASLVERDRQTVLMTPLGVEVVERARRLLARHPLIDGHNDLAWVIRNAPKAPGDVEAYDLRRRTPGDTDLARLREGRVPPARHVARAARPSRPLTNTHRAGPVAPAGPRPANSGGAPAACEGRMNDGLRTRQDARGRTR